MTPSFHNTVTGRFYNILEMWVIYGLFNPKFYETYFYNETKPEITNAEA